MLNTEAINIGSAVRSKEDGKCYEVIKLLNDGNSVLCQQNVHDKSSRKTFKFSELWHVRHNFILTNSRMKHVHDTIAQAKMPPGAGIGLVVRSSAEGGADSSSAYRVPPSTQGWISGQGGIKSAECVQLTTFSSRIANWNVVVYDDVPIRQLVPVKSNSVSTSLIYLLNNIHLCIFIAFNNTDHFDYDTSSDT